MEVWLIIVAALLGVAVGSFLNVCIDRLPAGESIVSPPSRCGACQRRLAVKDLIPVISYKAIGLSKRGWTEIFLIGPSHRTGRVTAAAENAVNDFVYPFSLCWTLQVLLFRRCS